jgi:hypothetical protein
MIYAWVLPCTASQGSKAVSKFVCILRDCGQHESEPTSHSNTPYYWSSITYSILVPSSTNIDIPLWPSTIVDVLLSTNGDHFTKRHGLCWDDSPERGASQVRHNWLSYSSYLFMMTLVSWPEKSMFDDRSFSFSATDLSQFQRTVVLNNPLFLLLIDTLLACYVTRVMMVHFQHMQVLIYICWSSVQSTLITCANTNFVVFRQQTGAWIVFSFGSTPTVTQAEV